MALAVSLDRCVGRFRAECALGGEAWWKTVYWGVMVNINCRGRQDLESPPLGVHMRMFLVWIN